MPALTDAQQYGAYPSTTPETPGAPGTVSSAPAPQITPAIGDEPIIRGEPTSPALSSLYPTAAPPTTAAVAPDEVQATMAGVQDATAATAVAAPGATAQQAVAGQVVGGPTEMSAAQQMADITAQDSPLMARARQQGLQTAARRGLLGSTIAAQQAMGAMVDRAMPLAQQDAATAVRLASEAADRETAVSSLNAQLGTDVSKFNDEQLQEAAMLNAQMQTAVSQGNAQAYNAAQQQFADLQTRAALTNADQQFRASSQYATERNNMVAQMSAQIQELNKQFLAGSQAIDLAQIQGQYQTLISKNESAARVFDSYLSGMANIMANKDISPSRVAQYVETQSAQLKGALSFIQNMDNTDLSTYVPGAGPGTPIKYPPIRTEPAPGGGATTTDPNWRFNKDVKPTKDPSGRDIRLWGFNRGNWRWDSSLQQWRWIREERSCFVAGTLVQMDGQDKRIEDVRIGDKLIGRGGVENEVLAFDHPRLGDRLLYSINGGKFFVTAEHPFATSTGWKSFDPAMTREENPHLEVMKLEIGDELQTWEGTEILKTISMTADHPKTPLYNFKLSGDNTYYADGYLVHNKAGD